MGNRKGGDSVMGEIVHFPNNKKNKDDKVDIIQVSKNKIIVNGVEYESMDLEDFIMNMEISPEAEERFIKGLFEIIKEECFKDWKLMKIFKEVFRK